MYCIIIYIFFFCRKKNKNRCRRIDKQLDQAYFFFFFKVIKLSKESYLYTLGGVVNSVNKENKVWSLTMENYSLLASYPKIIKPSAQKVVAYKRSRSLRAHMEDVWLNVQNWFNTRLLIRWM